MSEGGDRPGAPPPLPGQREWHGPSVQPPPLPPSTPASPAGPAPSGNDETDALAAVPDFARNSLRERGVDPSRFTWLMPAAAITLASGRKVSQGFLGETADRRLHVFRFSPADGFHHRGFGAGELATEVVAAGQEVTLIARAPPGGNPSRIDLVLSAADVPKEYGDWLSFWRPALRRTLGLGVSDPLVFAEATVLRVAEGGFGARHTGGRPTIVLGLAAGRLRLLPLLGDGEPVLRQHHSEGPRLDLLLDVDGAPTVVRASAVEARWSGHALTRLVAGLPAALRAPAPLGEEQLAPYGVLDVLLEGELHARRRLVRRDGEAIACSSDGSAPALLMDRIYRHGCHLVGLGEEGPCARFTLGDEASESTPGACPPAAADPATTLRRTGDGRFDCGVLLEPLSDPRPARLRLGRAGFDLGPNGIVPAATIAGVRVGEPEDGLHRLVIDTRLGDRLDSVSFGLPEALAFKLCECRDLLTTEDRLAGADLATLYRSLHQVRRYNLLALLFSDIVILDWELNSGSSIDELIEQAQTVAQDPRAHATLLEQLVERLLLLTVAIPQIKQKLEILAAVFPYSAAEHDARWVSVILDEAPTRERVADRRRGIVPAARRHLRLVQGDLGRALAEIEALSGPVDPLLQQDKGSEGWLGRLKDCGPAALHGLVVMGIFAANPASLESWNNLVSFIQSRSLKPLSSLIAHDSERREQVGHAALKILAWWKVFLHTLATTMHETGIFIDDQSEAAMERDGALIDSLPEAAREHAGQRLEAALRRQIMLERSSRYREILSGSHVRLSHIVEALQEFITVRFEADVSAATRCLGLPDEPHDAIGRLPA